MNVGVPPAIIDKKIQKDEEYFSVNHKYSMKRLKRICQKVKNISVGRMLAEVRSGAITEYDSEDY